MFGIKTELRTVESGCGCEKELELGRVVLAKIHCCGVTFAGDALEICSRGDGIGFTHFAVSEIERILRGNLRCLDGVLSPQNLSHAVQSGQSKTNAKRGRQPLTLVNPVCVAIH